MTPQWLASGAVIEGGIIQSVDPVSWTCVVATVGTSRRLHDCAIGAVYLHPESGEGVYVMPEAGALVWVAIPSDGNGRAFIIGYRAAVRVNAPTFDMRRGTVSPGDILLRGRDGNTVALRRGGVTEISGGPLARTVYVGTSGVIRSIAEQYDLSLLGGSLSWETFDEAEDPEGRVGSRLRWTHHAYLEDDKPIFESMFGAQVESNLAADAVASAVLFGDGTSSQAPVAELAMQPTGDLLYKTSAGIDLCVEGSPLVVYQSSASAAAAVVRAPDFLNRLSGVLAELQAALTAQALPSTQTAAMIAEITTALSSGNGYTSKSFTCE
ncbi:hypothetical protein EBT31_02855 [bacterium]|nr:hypothetical protein [bacterium]